MASETDALATIAAAVAIMWLGGKVKSLAKETDAEIITMQDYTVEVKPVRPARAPTGQASEPWDCYRSEKHDLCEVRKGELRFNGPVCPFVLVCSWFPLCTV